MAGEENNRGEARVTNEIRDFFSRSESLPKKSSWRLIFDGVWDSFYFFF